MKHIILSLLALLSVSCNALENLECLKEHPVKEAAETYITDIQSVESVLYAAYYQVKRDQCFSRILHTTHEAASDYAYALGSSYGPASLYEALDPTMIGRVNNSWQCLYRAMRFANTVIRNAPDIQKGTKEEIEAVIGEARFLRAFCYLHLVQNWGAVPLVTDQNMHQSGEINLPRVDVKTVLAQCVEDLVYAAEKLPAKQALIGRATKMAAYSVLTEVYLHQKEYKKAEEAALQVINSGIFSLVEVQTSDDFYKLYHPDLHSSSEEIFYLKYADGYDKELGSAFAAMLHRGGEYFSGSNYYGIYTTYENKRIADWPDADLRKSFNLYEFDSEGEILLYNKKFIATNANGAYAGNDLPLYRYADILLYYAEATCKVNNGPTADAVEKLNMVHRRAYGKPSTSPNAEVDYKLSDFASADEFMRVLLQERCYETCYEGKRFNDLRRLGILAEYVAEAKDGQTVGEAAYLYPIPNEEFLYNKGMNIDTDQNPGY